jgi:diacylglycerol kinase family enzyme
MRALLVVNHKATTTSVRSRDVLVRALRSEVDLEVAYTRRRGHAVMLARAAGESGARLVVVHGGDGTVNEVVNGLMATGDTARQRPALAVVPGGSTNVFARALGLPADWAEATGVILEALRDRRERAIGLGIADERYFTFCAGLGIDAAVVRRVEQARLRGRTSTPALYLRAAAGQFLGADRRHPSISMAAPGVTEERLATVIIQNTSPWTYLRDRPIDPNPTASFDRGLDVLALRTLRVGSAARLLGQILARGVAPSGKQVARWQDLPGLTLQSSRGMPFQLDGDYLGERRQVQLWAVPEALRVLGAERPEHPADTAAHGGQHRHR